MRLLNVHTLELKTFNRLKPHYAIASHRWIDGGETSFQDFQSGIRSSAGYQKVQRFATFVRDCVPDVQWLWIDTCCINKENSQELQENIIAMWKYYERATVCIAYLDDVSYERGKEIELQRSVWFTRGWTLQELLAPPLVVFLSQQWQIIGHKAQDRNEYSLLVPIGPKLNQTVASVANIPDEVIAQPQKRGNLSIEQRLRWLDSRTTTRPEDMSYSLLGIFDVSMPLIYEEGQTAARGRLIQAIRETHGTLAGREERNDVADSNTFRIPFHLDRIPITDYYVTREMETGQLESYFLPRTSSTTHRRSIFVVHGLGGMGKTQLCAHFVRDQQARFTAIFWLDGSSREALRQSFASVAARLPLEQRLPVGNEQTDAKAQGDINIVLQWLSSPSNTDWLLVIDNIDRDWQAEPKDPQAYDFHEFLPAADHGNVLITTRLATLSLPDASIHLRHVELDFGRKILERRTGKATSDAEMLAEKLGGLPLALAQAGAYLRQTNMTVNTYIQFYEDTWSRLMTSQDKVRPSEYQWSMITTWRMSYDRVALISPHAARLLDLWAFLHSGDVWYELIAASRDKISELPVWLCDFAADELTFQDSVSILSQYSLLNVASHQSGHSIHPVVHKWCLHNILDEAKPRFHAYVANLLANAIRRNERLRELKTARRLIPHAEVFSDRTIYSNGRSEALTNLECEISRFLWRWDLYSVALERLYQQALQFSLKASGPIHTSTLEIMNDLSVIYQNKDRLEEAEQLSLRALQGLDTVWGPDHVLTLDAMHNLSKIYFRQEKLEKAEQVLLRAVQGYKRVRGPDHISTLSTMNSLGVFYKDQGRHREAEQMFKRVLQGYDKAFAPDHTPILNTLHNLASLYLAQDNLGEAERMYLRALQGYENTVGSDHILTLGTVKHLGIVYLLQGKLGEAEQLLLRTLRGFQKLSNSNNTTMLDTIYYLGVLYTNQGRYEEAEQTLNRALRGYEILKGLNHKWALQTVIALGLLYAKQDRWEEAEQCYQRVSKHCHSLPSNILTRYNTLRQRLQVKNESGKELLD